VSALAETEEARDVSRARLMLVEQDFADAAERGRTLQREVLEAREQIELESLKARAIERQLEGSLAAPRAAELRGELDGARARLDEGEAAFATIASALDVARQEATDSARALVALGAEYAAIAKSQNAILLKNTELERVLAYEIQKESELSAELAGARAQEIVLRDQLGRAQRVAAGRVELLSAALRDTRESLLAISSSLPRHPERRASARTIDEGEGWTGEATEPGIPAYVQGADEQLALRDARIALLTQQLDHERARIAGVVRWLDALPGGAEPLREAAVSQLRALFGRPSE
jgi:hypothetical protein